MKQNQNFARNLEAFQRMKQLTLTEFAGIIGISKTTLRSILNEGNTTLDTAARISEKTGIPLDVLLADERLSGNFEAMRRLVNGLTWFQALGAEKQEKLFIICTKSWRC